MRPNKQISTVKRNLRLVIFESAITAGLLSMSIMTPFFNSIGLNQRQIALSQAIFTAVIFLLNFPAGWLADRFSRKWANVIGDFGVALTHLAYAKANSFLDVVICECLLGVFMAFSQGVDYSLLLHFTRKLDQSENFYKRQSSILSFWQYVATLILMLLGGPIGAIDFRLAIALSGASYLVGGMVSLFIKDDSVRLKPISENALKDMVRVAKYSFKEKRLRIRIFTYAIGREITHAIIWVFTPMLLLAGVPISVVSLAWAFNSLACIVGAKLAGKLAPKFKDSQILALPLALMSLSMVALSVNLDIWTVWWYLLMGVTQGWTGATLMPMVQKQAPPEEQTSIISLAKVVGQMLYIPVSLITGWAADIDLRCATLATIVMFLPLGMILVSGLKREVPETPD